MTNVSIADIISLEGKVKRKLLLGLKGRTYKAFLLSLIAKYDLDQKKTPITGKVIAVDIDSSKDMDLSMIFPDFGDRAQRGWKTVSDADKDLICEKLGSATYDDFGIGDKIRCAGFYNPGTGKLSVDAKDYKIFNIISLGR